MYQKSREFYRAQCFLSLGYIVIWLYERSTTGDVLEIESRQSIVITYEIECYVVQVLIIHFLPEVFLENHAEFLQRFRFYFHRS